MSKRIVLPPNAKPPIEVSPITGMPTAEKLIAEAIGIIQSELVRFGMKAKKGQSLDLKEARVLQGYIKALVDLSKENRDIEKQKDFSKMSDDELIAMVQVLLEKRKNTGTGSTDSSS